MPLWQNIPTECTRQYRMMKLVLAYYHEALEVLDRGADIEALVNLPVREEIGRYKYTEEAGIQPAYEAIRARLKEELAALLKEED